MDNLTDRERRIYTTINQLAGGQHRARFGPGRRVKGRLAAVMTAIGPNLGEQAYKDLEDVCDNPRELVELVNSYLGRP